MLTARLDKITRETIDRNVSQGKESGEIWTAQNCDLVGHAPVRFDGKFSKMERNESSVARTEHHDPVLRHATSLLCSA